MVEKKNLRIVYMGTPDFAVEALRCLVEGGYNVVGVITMPDKPAGRGHKLQFSPVKQYALEHNLPLLQPEKDVYKRQELLSGGLCPKGYFHEGLQSELAIDEIEIY